MYFNIKKAVDCCASFIPALTIRSHIFIPVCMIFIPERYFTFPKLNRIDKRFGQIVYTQSAQTQTSTSTGNGIRLYMSFFCALLSLSLSLSLHHTYIAWLHHIRFVHHFPCWMCESCLPPGKEDGILQTTHTCGKFRKSFLSLWCAERGKGRGRTGVWGKVARDDPKYAEFPKRDEGWSCRHPSLAHENQPLGWVTTDIPNV